MRKKPLFLTTSALIAFIILGQRYLATYDKYTENSISYTINSTVERAIEFAPDTKVQPTRATVFLVGDVMLGRSVMGKSLDVGDTSYPFQFVSETLTDSDIVFANLENPITANCQRHTGGFKFCAPPSMLSGLTLSGINVVTLANNHSRNYGTEGFEETKVHLDNAGIKYAGDDNLVVMDVKGTKFGFLGFDFLSNIPSEKDIQLILDSDPKVDVLIVGVHWGVEYTSEPLTEHRELAQKMVEAGADVVSGHHPHWIQSTDSLQALSPQAVPVYYSLGNFVFDQMWSETTKKGLVIKLTFDGDEIVDEERLYTYMPQFAQPVFVSE